LKDAWKEIVFYFLTQTKMKNTQRASIPFLLSFAGLLLAVLLIVPSHVRAQEVADTGSGTVLSDPGLTTSDNQNENQQENTNSPDSSLNVPQTIIIQGGIHPLPQPDPNPLPCLKHIIGVTLTADPTTVRVSEPVTFTATTVSGCIIFPDVKTANLLPKPAISILPPPGAEYYNALDFGDGNIDYPWTVDVPIQHAYTRPGVYNAFFEYSQQDGHFVSDPVQITVVQGGGGGGGGLLPAQLTAYSADRTDHFPPQIEQLHNAANSREVTFKVTNDEGIDPNSIVASINDQKAVFTMQEIEKGYLVTLTMPSDPTIKEFYIVISAKSKNNSDTNYKELRILVANPFYSISAELESLKPAQPVVVLAPQVSLKSASKAITFTPNTETKKIVRAPAVRHTAGKGQFKPVVKKMAVPKVISSHPSFRLLLSTFLNHLMKPFMSMHIIKMAV
jgi:hypothetical protein